MERYVRRIITHAQRGFYTHVATLRKGDFGIDVLDFMRSDGSVIYNMRVIFDHERTNRVFIAGDLGEAVIYPTCPATLKGMADCFTRRDEEGEIEVNPWYFLEKVAESSDRYEWSYENFREDFDRRVKEYGLILPEDFYEDFIDSWCPDISIDSREGVIASDRAKSALADIDRDYQEWLYDCGKRVSPRVIMWLVALRLAWEAVEKNERRQQ